MESKDLFPIIYGMLPFIIPQRETICEVSYSYTAVYREKKGVGT